MLHLFVYYECLEKNAIHTKRTQQSNHRPNLTTQQPKQPYHQPNNPPNLTSQTTQPLNHAPNPTTQQPTQPNNPINQTTQPPTQQSKQPTQPNHLTTHPTRPLLDRGLRDRIGVGRHRRSGGRQPWLKEGWR